MADSSPAGVTAIAADASKGVSAAASAVRARVFEIGGLGLLTCAFFALYVLIGYPIYNNATWLDPWYYTGLFVNFHFLSTTFPSAYYGTRLPWLIPGRFLFGVFSPSVAYLVLHVAFGIAATGFLYLLVRRYFGRGPAVITFAAAAASPVYYHSLYRDYVNSGELTYLLAGAYFGLALRAGRRPRMAMGAAGFFLIAAVATHFLAALFIGAFIVPYVILFRPSWKVFRSDATAFLAGAVVLFFVCGVYSRANGGPFDFMKRGLNALRSFSGAGYKRKGFNWLLSEPRVFVPFFLLAIVVLATAGVWRTLEPIGRRAALALGAYLTVTYAFVLAWEFAGSGILIEWFDYYEIFFSVTLIPFVGVAAWSLLRLAPPGWLPVALACGGATSVLPPLLIYRLGWISYVDERGAVLSGVIMLLTLGVVVALVLSRGRRKSLSGILAVLAVSGLGLGFAYPVSASRDIRSNMDFTKTVNAIDTGVFHAGIAWVRWMRVESLQDPHMVTWYDGRDQYFNGFPSLYYFGWFLQDGNMPRVTPAFKELWRQRNPSEIVLLCDRRDCEQAPRALRRAGIVLHPFAQREFVSGPVRLWVRVLKVTPRS